MGKSSSLTLAVSDRGSDSGEEHRDIPPVPLFRSVFGRVGTHYKKVKVSYNANTVP